MACYGRQTADFSVPLHVDCSVEYELPDCAKPPVGVQVEPLLMIHPCHFRNLERQKRRPFENNLPGGRRRSGPAWEPYLRPQPGPRAWIPDPPYLPPPPQMPLPLPLPLPCYEAV